MMAGIQTAKKDLRKRMRDVLQRIPADSVASQSRTVANRLFALAEYQKAKRIGIYLSMPTGELSTTHIVQDALKNHKEVFVPYIHSTEATTTQQKTSVMDMLTLESMEEFMSLERDKWGIPSLTKAQALSKTDCFGGTGLSAPTAKNPAAKPSGLDLIVMPGMAFDPEFRRLGHGKGYYDSFLTRYLRWEAEIEATTRDMPLLVALSLKEQTLSPPEEVPVTNHDWLVDILIVGDDRCLVRQR
ncbi:5-formyltetrahydrofolate cyclo-ligase [Aspergillus lucknowensis]|uniref:5-formyltetrahydrofolate cyclo-ligase n=1 Tax=Aspergillus lucknowensis TaxID=176173 RepID=A0ABR4LRQ0_9EURO